MNPTDFGLSILASWLANKFLEPDDNDLNHDKQLPIKESVKATKKKKFNTYDVFTDLKKMLDFVSFPIAHIVVETTPTTFYNLATLVIEDKETGLWFVFRRGRMSFQGSGGGAQQTDRAIDIFKSRNIPIVPWSVTKEILDDLEGGFVLWYEIKNNLVPLLASNVDSTKWPWIQKQAKEVIYNEYEDVEN